MSVWEGNHFLNPEGSFKIKINANSALEIRETLVPYVYIVLAYLAKVNAGYSTVFSLRAYYELGNNTSHLNF